MVKFVFTNTAESNVAFVRLELLKSASWSLAPNKLAPRRSALERSACFKFVRLNGVNLNTTILEGFVGTIEEEKQYECKTHYKFEFEKGIFKKASNVWKEKYVENLWRDFSIKILLVVL